MTGSKVTRRRFLRESGVGIGKGLILACGLPLAGTLVARRASASDKGLGQGTSDFSPSAFISIGADRKIRLFCHRSEMGQGTRTAMAMLIAEELEVDLDQVEVVQAEGHERYGDQGTEGSQSVIKNWLPLRELGAIAREMLVAAAAQRWEAPASECTAARAQVHHRKSGRVLDYFAVAQAASAIPVPKAPKLKERSEFRIVGKPSAGVDLARVTAGAPHFGIDAHLDGMLHASVERCPQVGGRIRSVERKAEALAVPGVRRVIRLPALGTPLVTEEAVAVVADSTWAALQGRKAVRVNWKAAPQPSSSELARAMEERVRQPGKVYRSWGDFESTRAGAARTLEATYRAPYLVHATMEPPSCLARVDARGCEIWAPTQDPQGARKAAAALLKLPLEKVRVNVTWLGGAFGRKSQVDFVLEAVALARETRRPVKVTWTREDEIRHGFYHAVSVQALAATLDSSGKISGWRHRSVFPSIMKLFDPTQTEPGDWELALGASNFPYRIPNFACEGAPAESPVRVGWLRSVCNLFHAFAVNGFVDEIAQATGKDPVELRLELLKPHGVPDWDAKTTNPYDSGRLARVIELAAREGGWGRMLPTGHGMGFASHYSFQTHVAMTLEADVFPTEAPVAVRVKRVHCAVDCGSMVNPDMVRSQLEGSIVFGLSAALHGRISLKGGAVEQSNFHDYPVLRMSECPEIHVHLLESDRPPSGAGEPGVPPVAPALAGAIFAATGKRVRELPIARQFA